MVHLSSHRKIGVVTIAVVVLVVLVAFMSGTGENEALYLTPADTVGASAPLGETITVLGTVISMTDEGYAIGCEDEASSQVLTVILSKSAGRRVNLGSGVVTMFEGTLAAPAVLEDATHVGRSGPAKYNPN